MLRVNNQTPRRVDLKLHVVEVGSRIEEYLLCFGGEFVNEFVQVGDLFRYLFLLFWLLEVWVGELGYYFFHQ